MSSPKCVLGADLGAEGWVMAPRRLGPLAADVVVITCHPQCQRENEQKPQFLQCHGSEISLPLFKSPLT